jgi:mRNA interferase RelE/StbE
MSTVKILAETEDTVTISRGDWQRLQEELENAEDHAAVAARRAHENLVGTKVARRNYLTATEALRLLNGESPVKVWREKRGLSQRALAAEAHLADSYLAEIETNRKPGSDDAYRKLSATLQVPPDDLDGRRNRTRQPDYGPVVLSYSPPHAGVSSGQRADSAKQERFPTLGEALNSVRERWSELSSRGAYILDTDYHPIYLQAELFQEMGGPPG